MSNAEEETTLTVVFSVMAGAAVVIICLALFIYKWHTNKQSESNRHRYRVSETEDSTHNSDYADNTLSEEDALMTPYEREDTISSLKKELDDLAQGIYTIYVYICVYFVCNLYHL